jgi:hypothetical protein
MIQINRNKIADKIVFTVPLESEMRITGLLHPIKSAPPRIWVWGNASNTGEMHTDKSNYTAITEIYLNTKNASTVDVTDWLLTFELGDYVTLDEVDTEDFGIFKISTVPVLNGNIFSFNVEAVEGSGSTEGGINVIVKLSKYSMPSDVMDIPDIELMTDGEITGFTNSKLSYIVQSFPLGQVTNDPIIIRGTSLIGQIISSLTADVIEYNIRVDDDIIIYYKDVSGSTMFTFTPSYTVEYSDEISFLLQYLTLIDEPKLDSNLFINRGVNNVFESFKRLKTVANTQELEQTGFGYYKMISDGIR